MERKVFPLRERPRMVLERVEDFSFAYATNASPSELDEYYSEVSDHEKPNMDEIPNQNNKITAVRV